MIFDVIWEDIGVLKEVREDFQLVIFVSIFVFYNFEGGGWGMGVLEWLLVRFSLLFVFL